MLRTYIRFDSANRVTNGSLSRGGCSSIERPFWESHRCSTASSYRCLRDLWAAIGVRGIGILWLSLSVRNQGHLVRADVARGHSCGVIRRHKRHPYSTTRKAAPISAHEQPSKRGGPQSKPRLGPLIHSLQKPRSRMEKPETWDIYRWSSYAFYPSLPAVAPTTPGSRWGAAALSQ